MVAPFFGLGLFVILGMARIISRFRGYSFELSEEEKKPLMGTIVVALISLALIERNNFPLFWIIYIIALIIIAVLFFSGFQKVEESVDESDSVSDPPVKNACQDNGRVTPEEDKAEAGWICKNCQKHNSEHIFICQCGMKKSENDKEPEPEEAEIQPEIRMPEKEVKENAPEKAVDYGFIKVYAWDYYVSFYKDGMEVFHCVTPADGGNGQNVRWTYKDNYLEAHTIEELYEDIGTSQLKPDSWYVDRKKELDELRKAVNKFSEHYYAQNGKKLIVKADPKASDQNMSAGDQWKKQMENWWFTDEDSILQTKDIKVWGELRNHGHPIWCDFRDGDESLLMNHLERINWKSYSCYVVFDRNNIAKAKELAEQISKAHPRWEIVWLVEKDPAKKYEREISFGDMSSHLINEWYAPFEDCYYETVVEYYGWSHDGSGDYFDLYTCKVTE